MNYKNVVAEYIWIDGYLPTPNLRSKARVLNGRPRAVCEIPVWSFDGSSTRQADGKSSDCQLKPVSFFKDPFRGEPHILVLCEVLNADGSEHKSNTRQRLRSAAERFAATDPMFGIEQEYTLFLGDQPLGWPATGEPRTPQGLYYCGANSGDDFVDLHLEACLKAGVKIYGINSEVMLGQWEFQVGTLGPLEVADHLLAARWILARLGRRLGLRPCFDPKPRTGDWNGAGCHTNFSTKAMREPGGIAEIERACERLGAAKDEHVKTYGAGNARRLTGRHETCDISQFRYGASDRGASIRVPLATIEKGCGYLEDRRPAANMDPYLVCAAMLETICGDGFKAPAFLSEHSEQYLGAGFEEIWPELGPDPMKKKSFIPVNGA